MKYYLSQSKLKVHFDSSFIGQMAYEYMALTITNSYKCTWAIQNAFVVLPVDPYSIVVYTGWVLLYWTCNHRLNQKIRSWRSLAKKNLTGAALSQQCVASTKCNNIPATRKQLMYDFRHLLSISLHKAQYAKPVPFISNKK